MEGALALWYGLVFTDLRGGIGEDVEGGFTAGGMCVCGGYVAYVSDIAVFFGSTRLVFLDACCASASQGRIRCGDCRQSRRSRVDALSKREGVEGEKKGRWRRVTSSIPSRAVRVSILIISIRTLEINPAIWNL